METFIKTLIYIHAFLGGVGLLSGLSSIYFRKGNTSHKKFGKIFSAAMISSSLISLIIARLPNHENTFLFLIGLFTIYMILAGNRALTFKSKEKSAADTLDKIISGSMLFISIIMLGLGVLGILQKIEGSILYVFFAGFGLFMSVNDFKNFKRFTTNKIAYLKSHIGRMVGALIASFTAFLVAGLHFNEIIYWMAPTVLGTVYIIYWIKKVDKPKVSAIK